WQPSRWTSTCVSCKKTSKPPPARNRPGSRIGSERPPTSGHFGFTVLDRRHGRGARHDDPPGDGLTCSATSRAIALLTEGAARAREVEATTAPEVWCTALEAPLSIASSRCAAQTSSTLVDTWSQYVTSPSCHLTKRVVPSFETTIASASCTKLHSR